ncbi:hypothetical protein G7Z17_g12096 [Cylindrodendrum hubeiense]|uniref:DUF7707 domain-containing protein n=1 Tax=Cylindrodendrum hubeiense TaxID=595255 RepID=A0A9P5GW11_9HYPO|nr:hypothetical protein G7Z17_g12096 [Cylindrodendrum hubeiense]
MRFSLALLTAAAVAVSADVANYTSSLNMTIDPGTVETQERATWCQAQTNTCSLLCDNDTEENGCTQGDLSWECTCSSNSSAPGLQYYTQTVPTFICQELYSQCITTNAGDSTLQEECVTNIQDLCATQNPPDADDSSSSTTETATATATKSSSTAEATEDSVTSTSSDGFAPTMAPAGKGAAAAVALGMLAYLV